MLAIYELASLDIQKVTAAKAANDLANQQLFLAYGDVKDLSTRSKNIFIVSGVPDTAISKCESLNHLIQGSRIEAIKADDGKNHISASHQSRTQMIQHVDGYIKLFSAYPQYNPPANITAVAWTAKRDAMQVAKQAGYVTDTNLKMARLDRNLTIQKPVTGLVDVGNGVKKTVLGIFGFKSPEYALVKGIEFRRIPGYKNL